LNVFNSKLEKLLILLTTPPKSAIPIVTLQPLTLQEEITTRHRGSTYLVIDMVGRRDKADGQKIN
jgi:hypothetical protein